MYQLVRNVVDAVWQAPGVPDRTPIPRRLRRKLWIAWAAGLVITGFTFGMFSATYFPLSEENHIEAAAGLPVSLLQTLPLLWAARAPLVAWRVMLVGMAVAVFVPVSSGWPWAPGACIAFALVLFYLSYVHERRLVVGATAVSVGVIWLPGALVSQMDPVIALLALAVFTVPPVLGDSIRARRTAELSLAVSEEERRGETMRRAVLEERSRIARELHDIVAHHMSVIAVQAEAAPYRMPDLPEQAVQTFGTIRVAAKEALTETRRVVGLLRSTDAAAERAPQPHLARIEELIGEARGAGMAVGFRVDGSPAPVPAGVGLSAFRIVQESLSNARRHAPGAWVQVHVGYDESEISLLIKNGSSRSPVEREEGREPGHGLLGMRERVTLLGGSLSAEPDADGGFTVRAVLPL
ncbi:sensor histidine kinase [Rhizohabitans arisaemae]|uniref:sensor histidine kinase n=1 Tax=Rhizohabitans arisaemae TaxID=2720610 RepID=UPI0024B05873|nr:sensor histidine kinase [Rhizohabitans arisaemae]